MRHVVWTTLLLFGLSLSVSPVLLAEEAAEEEDQSSEESAQDTPEEAPTEPLPATGEPDWEAELDAMIDDAKAIGIGDLDARDDEWDADDELNWRISDERSARQTLHGGRYLWSALIAGGVGFGTGNFMNGSKKRGFAYFAVDMVSTFVLFNGVSFCDVVPVGFLDGFQLVDCGRVGIGLTALLASRSVQLLDCLIEPLVGGRMKSSANRSSSVHSMVWRPFVGESQAGLQIGGRF